MTKAFKYFMSIIPLIYGHYAFAQSVDVSALQTVLLPAEQIILVTPEQCQLLPPPTYQTISSIINLKKI
jgi:hypothetical protein